MKMSGIGILILIVALILSSGCTQSQPATIPGPGVSPATTIIAQPPATAAEQVTNPAAAVFTPAPKVTVTVTVIHDIVPFRQWKDSELRMAFEAPQDWNVTTRRLSLPEGSQGIEYQTDLVSNEIFYIRTFPISLNQDQAYRDTFRKWDPVPSQTTVTSNGIIFDRFESTKDGKTHVGYVARKGSASDIGFSSVIVFTADASKPFEKEDFEKVVASFAYFTRDQAATMTGEEIPRVR